MAKLATQWATANGNDGSTTISTSDLLMETGDILLQEDNTSYLLLEDVIIITKESTSWSNPTDKNAGLWRSSSGSDTSSELSGTSYRLTQNGVDFRVLQNGVDGRILNTSVVKPKIPATWSVL
jgi:hypothetical protein